MTVIRRSMRWASSLLLLVVTIGCAAYIVPGLLGYERYVITGGSMTGSIDKGSIAFEKAVPVAELVVGDVITYLPPPDSGVSTLVTHRIISIGPGTGGTSILHTQGDANPDPDPWLFSLTSGTQPVVEHAVPWAGSVFVGLADPQVRLLVIGIPAGLIALVALRDLVTALRPPRSKPGKSWGTSVEQQQPAAL
ncbi:signal peptidase I [Knoellia sp. CPCC 206453]|uniref:signal peptidase I n=1 Tax=Knoellia pratensis TaxID=3404796 RepID=UPI0036091C14